MHVGVYRQLLPPDTVAEIRRLLDEAYGCLEAGGSRKLQMFPLSKPLTKETLTPLQLLLLQTFWRSSMPKSFAELTQAEPMLLLSHCTVRVRAPTDVDEAVGWHLDSNFWTFQTPIMTFWTALSEAGEHAPGLELAIPSASTYNKAHLRNKYVALVNQRMQSGSFSFTAEEDEIETMIGSYRRHVPRVLPGDAIGFDGYAFHRTQALPTATRSRIAIEFRLLQEYPLPTRLNDETLNKKVCVQARHKGGFRIMTIGQLRDQQRTVAV